MSSPNQTGNLAKSYYEILHQIPNRRWKEFARVGLGLSDHFIDDLEHNYRGDVAEQKYQAIKQWETMKGDGANLSGLRASIDEFLKQGIGRVSGGASNDFDIVIVFHEVLSPQVSIAKRRLEEKWPVVNTIICKKDGDVSHESISQIEQHRFRIFILTGQFQLNNLPSFLEFLRECSNENTLLIARKAIASEEISHLPLKAIKTMSGQDIFGLVDEFVSDHSQRVVNDSVEKISPRPGSFLQLAEKEQHVEQDEEEEEVEELDSEKYEEHVSLLKGKGFPDCYYDRKHAYILITSPIRERNPRLKSIVSIPWLRVFDFDPKSRVLGVLSNVEDALKSLRHFTTTDAKDRIENPEDRTTNWVFINGYCDSDFEEYKEATEISPRAIFDHCDSLVNYCVARKVPKIVVLWYPSNTNYDELLDSFMTSLRYHFKSQLNSFSCILCLPAKPHKHSVRAHMIKRLKIGDSVAIVPLNVVCRFVKSADTTSASTSESKTLPQFSQNKGEKGTFLLAEKDHRWLDVCFDVVASNAHETDAVDDIAVTGEEFLKGGKLDWHIIATGKYDAGRDILQESVKSVRKRFIETGKSGIITIFHPPGGGGTTFARRLLWELRKEAPCLELLSMELSIDEVKKRLSFIRNETHLPAVLLIDGNSPMDVKTLLENCRYEKLVILHVQRFYSSYKSLNKKKKTDLIWVPENVSVTESKSLLEIFSNVRPNQKGPLMGLAKEVTDGKNHCMFEYGLTAYESEYRGVKSYVHGNLQISRETQLSKWHKVLTYLSLAHYYGHCGLPSKLFASLLGKTDEEIVTLNDLPHPARKFVIEDHDDDWRITYYIIAKEILEQVLVKRSQPEYSVKANSLSPEARQNLWNIAIDFIRFVKENLDNLQTEVPSHIQDLLTSVLIKRNYKDAGENDEFGNRSKYSRLIEDATKVEQKQKILVCLVESFPTNAEFHAHLGRFYGINKQFTEAEECFTKAFEVRKNEKRKRQDKNNSGDPVLHRINSMYGFYLNEQIRNELKENARNKQTVKSVLEKAERAVLHFQKSKHHYQKGCNPTYVYIGEIKVRLMLAEFAYKLTKGNIASLRNDQEPFSTLCEFVFESFSHCDQLLVQCMYHAEEHNIPQDELESCINHFNTFFKNTEMALRNWVGDDRTVHSKKCHVAILKIDMTEKKKDSPTKFQVYEHVSELSYLNKLIKLYEGIFSDAQTPGLEHHLISNYMMEWLQAIRHPALQNNFYALTKVNSSVEFWDSKNERGSLATFYHYVLTTLLAINGPRGEVTNRYSEQSCILKGKIKDCMVPLPLVERTAEWLAKSENTQSFGNLIHRNLLGEWDGKFWKKDKAALLKVCEGKITTCKIWYGHIVLDGGQQPEITVFFNPQRYGFSGSDSRQKIRVEFYVGFNPNHGAEAYQVTRLVRDNCPGCGTPTEISKLGKEESHWVGKCPKCDGEVRPKK